MELKLTRMHGGKPWMTAFDNPYVQAAGRAIEAGFGKRPVFNREGGSIPVVSTFQEELGLPCVLFGVGLPDENAHAPDEKLDSRQLPRRHHLRGAPLHGDRGHASELSGHQFIWAARLRSVFTCSQTCSVSLRCVLVLLGQARHLQVRLEVLQRAETSFMWYASRPRSRSSVSDDGCSASSISVTCARLRERSHPHVEPLQVQQHPDHDLPARGAAPAAIGERGVLADVLAAAAPRQSASLEDARRRGTGR